MTSMNEEFSFPYFKLQLIHDYLKSPCRTPALPATRCLVLILFENQKYPLSTCLDELKFYRRLRFLGYF